MVSFVDAVEDATAGQPKTKQRDYLATGSYPVVDQGQSLISGYTDDETMLARVDLPVLVFGDHTRCVKYLDFAFGAGADGVKILRPRDGVHPRFLYHFLSSVPLHDGGYARHYKYLREVAIPLPPIEEQRRIAAFLDLASQLRAKRQQALATLDTFTHAVFTKMFGSTSSNPNGYEVAKLIELVDPARPITYGILKPGENVDGGQPYVRVVDMVDEGIDTSKLKRTSTAISQQYKRSLLAEGDLLLSIRGHVGRLALVEADAAGANITQDSARLAVTGANPHYVLACLRSEGLQAWMRTFTKGAAVRGINLTDVKAMPVPLPPRSEQDQFESIARAVRATRVSHVDATRRLASLSASLQQRAFRGEL